MILALIEDKTCCVYDSPEELSNDIEPLDVDRSVLGLFDETGRVYNVEWIIPNKYRTFLGIIKIAQNGRYRLVPSDIIDERGLLDAIRKAESISPTSATERVGEIERRLAIYNLS